MMIQRGQFLRNSSNLVRALSTNAAPAAPKAAAPAAPAGGAAAPAANAKPQEPAFTKVIAIYLNTSSFYFLK